MEQPPSYVVTILGVGAFNVPLTSPPIPDKVGGEHYTLYICRKMDVWLLRTDQ